MPKTVLDILKTDNVPAPPRVKTVCDAISTRHRGRVLAFQYYGSSLRDMNNPEKMLDFYVIVDSYRRTHKNPIRALLNKIIPPAVYYYEHVHEDGILSTCKYSIISIYEFEKRAGKEAFLSLVWGRFSQPSALLFPVDETIKSRLMAARTKAVTYMAAQTAPLIDAPVTSTQFWARGFRESYKTELRPESSDARSEEIVARYQKRYEDLTTALYGQPGTDGLYSLPSISNGNKVACKGKWLLRRLFGKPMTGIRVINSAFTFDGGLDYILRKLKNHSGAEIEVTEAQRRHPILWSPVLAWKLYRKGAFN